MANVQYTSHISKQGFLLGRESNESLKELLEKAHIFLVDEEEGKVKGYIIADHTKEFKDNENKVWLDAKAKEYYYEDDQSMTIESIAVSNNHLHQGVGSKLLLYLEDELISRQYKYLFSIISIAPVQNDASVSFHEKNHFRKVAESKPRTLFEIENYAAALYFKEL
jgi:ribosomal protein S18 acetylase RimI-like enzyme